MPELPEVETTRRGIEPHLLHQLVQAINIHDGRLRWPVPEALYGLVGTRITGVARRAKYLLVATGRGTLIIHLGMSGSLRLVSSDAPLKVHDHVELVLGDGSTALRYHDPRRFGCILLTSEPVETHPLLASLGPEPLSADFDGDRLFARSRRRSAAVKTFIMDNRIVVGVGNIYASEALFLSGIRPGRAAGRVTRVQYGRLADNIRLVLSRAIEAGGTTLRDFLDSNGNPGYFRQQLNVYGRTGQLCRVCQSPIKVMVLGQRSSFYCAQCQR